jgi:hypothetical protein
MPEILNSAIAAGPPISWLQVLVRLVIAAVLGWFVAAVYERTRPPAERTPSFPATLVLLSVLIAMVTQVIGDNVARAFSLVGALSIVRFRTVVRDTEDTAFVIFAVVIGMAVGGNNLTVALTGLVVTTAAAFWMNSRAAREGAGPSYLVRVRAGLGRDLDALIPPALVAHVAEHRLASIATARQGMSLEASYRVRLRDRASAGELVKALNRIDGVQSVELETSTTGIDDRS